MDGKRVQTLCGLIFWWMWWQLGETRFNFDLVKMLFRRVVLILYRICRRLTRQDPTIQGASHTPGFREDTVPRVLSPEHQGVGQASGLFWVGVGNVYTPGEFNCFVMVGASQDDHVLAIRQTNRTLESTFWGYLWTDNIFESLLPVCDHTCETWLHKPWINCG